MTAEEDRQEHGAWRSGKRHHSTLAESRWCELEPNLCPFSTLAKTWEANFQPNLEVSILPPFFRAPIDFFSNGLSFIYFEDRENRESVTSLGCKLLAMEPGLRTRACQPSVDFMIFMYTMPVHSSTLPVHRADKYEEDNSRALVSILKRQEAWEGSLENTKGAVFEFKFKYDIRLGGYVICLFLV